ncbi:hypothetical protein [Lacticaseibacillus paracasei]|uniref:hypothetical protein n=1 Tax=Lacticaseibacillus paracasei TaxID=1597 RepID=UPI0005178283|nr:hypothetical protein [Lacticaseibacillus paracasei]NLT82522.1 hypothetical protein [Lacticaseibacillus paracasei subsp. paracasei]AWN85038.1 hypothetical protein LPEG9_14385 [Lacticaseibacillus paracasei]MCO7166554.1 hypothetical protein [Lacticaseibacillus paracasei]MDB7799044.1 hypothetical protein [Lacticaseibacillus paracasei]MDB7801653.1 hypothetical protein [Lacticaseibacillus paracasei]
MGIFHVACDRAQQKGPLGGRPFCCDRLGDDRRLLLWRSKNEKVGLGFVGMSGWLISMFPILPAGCERNVKTNPTIGYRFVATLFTFKKERRTMLYRQNCLKKLCRNKRFQCR